MTAVKLVTKRNKWLFGTDSRTSKLEDLLDVYRKDTNTRVLVEGCNWEHLVIALLNNDQFTIKDGIYILAAVNKNKHSTQQRDG